MRESAKDTNIIALEIEMSHRFVRFRASQREQTLFTRDTLENRHLRPIKSARNSRDYRDTRRYFQPFEKEEQKKRETALSNDDDYRHVKRTPFANFHLDQLARRQLPHRRYFSEPPPETKFFPVDLEASGWPRTSIAAFRGFNYRERRFSRT